MVVTRLRTLQGYGTTKSIQSKQELLQTILAPNTHKKVDVVYLTLQISCRRLKWGFFKWHFNELGLQKLNVRSKYDSIHPNRIVKFLTRKTTKLVNQPHKPVEPTYGAETQILKNLMIAQNSKIVHHQTRTACGITTFL